MDLFGLKCPLHLHFSFALVRKSTKEGRCFGWEPFKCPIWPINLWFPSHQIFWNLQEGIYILINSFLPFNIWVQRSVIPQEHPCEFYFCHLLRLWWLSVKGQVTILLSNSFQETKRLSTSRYSTAFILGPQLDSETDFSSAQISAPPAAEIWSHSLYISFGGLQGGPQRCSSLGNIEFQSKHIGIARRGTNLLSSL